jgi:hypothetical protein
MDYYYSEAQASDLSLLLLEFEARAFMARASWIIIYLRLEPHLSWLEPHGLLLF